MKILRTIILIGGILLIIGCANNQVEREFNKEGEELRITFSVYKGEHSFMRSVKNPRKGLNGECTYSPDDNVCHISVLSKGTVVVDGVFTTSIGHEVMHCLYGDYHK